MEIIPTHILKEKLRRSNAKYLQLMLATNISPIIVKFILTKNNKYYEFQELHEKINFLEGPIDQSSLDLTTCESFTYDEISGKWESEIDPNDGFTKLKIKGYET